MASHPPLKHKLLSKEIFKSQKWLRSEPEQRANALAWVQLASQGFAAGGP